MDDEKVMIDDLGPKGSSQKAITTTEKTQQAEPAGHELGTTHVPIMKTDMDETEHTPLSPTEVCLLIEADIERLKSFAATDRLHAINAKGDSPLHIAAGMGKLAACDLFVRAGANPALLNFAQQTPADLAIEKGHLVVAQELSSLITRTSKTFKNYANGSSIESSHAVNDMASDFCVSGMQASEFETNEDLDDLPAFEAEADPEVFHKQHTGETISGTFVVLSDTASVVTSDEDGDWELDISPVVITGEGLVSTSETDDGNDSEHDFLKVRGSGRQSIKRVKIQTGTRLSIDSGLCLNWAREILAKGHCTIDDIDYLIALCEGNGDPDDLRLNIRRNLETAGFNSIHPSCEYDAGLWDLRTEISADDLAESIEAILNRSTRLPGTQRFVMDKSEELHLLEPMTRAKQELHLAILASEVAVNKILATMTAIRDGLTDPGAVSLRTITPSRPDHPDTAEVMDAAETLRSWQLNGRVMDGKLRREAVKALETLDLSVPFHKDLVQSLKQNPACLQHSIHLDKLISDYEAAAERLMLVHLPYARRFASRNTNDGEDVEDVFQVAFMGLQRSIRRFAPERGNRFVVYCTFWMQQALTRWRADEGSIIRVPVHRHDNLMKLDQAFNRLATSVVSDKELAVKLEWSVEQVRQARTIPRKAEYPESMGDWDELLHAPEEDIFTEDVSKEVVEKALAELLEREANVIRLRFGIGCHTEMTLEEVGELHGVTRERIRQIEAKALKRLSNPERKYRLHQELGI